VQFIQTAHSDAKKPIFIKFTHTHTSFYVPLTTSKLKSEILLFLLTPTYGYCQMILNYVCEILKVCVQTDINKCKTKSWKQRSRNRPEWQVLQRGECPEGTVVPSKKKKVKKFFKVNKNYFVLGLDLNKKLLILLYVVTTNKNIGLLYTVHISISVHLLTEYVFVRT
jgi:hypothetical protein